MKIKSYVDDLWHSLKMIIMSNTDETSKNLRDAAISVLTALLYSLAIVKGDDEQEQLSNFLDIILQSLYYQNNLINKYHVFMFYFYYRF